MTSDTRPTWLSVEGATLVFAHLGGLTVRTQEASKMIPKIGRRKGRNREGISEHSADYYWVSLSQAAGVQAAIGKWHGYLAKMRLPNPEDIKGIELWDK
jgi:hypothetical protein